MISANALDFLPLDRSGNRRFLPIMVHPEQSEVHILEDEAASRQYMDQLWAEAMTLYRRGKVQLKLSKEMNEQLVLLQKQFMPEDTKVGVIQAFLDDFNGDMVCSKLLHHEALGRFDEPKSWEIREINEIMNQSVTGWIPYAPGGSQGTVVCRLCGQRGRSGGGICGVHRHVPSERVP